MIAHARRIGCHAVRVGTAAAACAAPGSAYAAVGAQGLVLYGCCLLVEHDESRFRSGIFTTYLLSLLSLTLTLKVYRVCEVWQHCRICVWLTSFFVAAVLL